VAILGKDDLVWEQRLINAKFIIASAGKTPILVINRIHRELLMRWQQFRLNIIHRSRYGSKGFLKYFFREIKTPNQHKVLN
jgi:hypothetical protein